MALKIYIKVLRNRFNNNSFRLLIMKLILYQILISQLVNCNSNSGNFTRTPEEFVRLEWEAFERERDEFVRSGSGIENAETLSRHKRTVMFNNLAPIDLGVLIGFPLTVVLPSLSNFFNKKWKRSIPDDYDPNENFDAENPILQPHVDRISAYFELIKVPEKGCQERAICEFSAEPDRYFPISELILSRLRNPSTLPLMGYLENFGDDGHGADEKTRNSLFSLYNNAADHGLANGAESCHKLYSSKCLDPIETRLNMPVLKFWNFLSSALKFKLKDDIKIHAF